MINKLFRLIVMGLLIIASSLALAVSGWRFLPDPKEQDTNAAFHKRLPGEFKDDITQEQEAIKVTLTAKELHQAGTWGLSIDEEKRYLFLMQNQSGLHYAKKDVSPVEVLGINARDDKERAYYSILYAKQTLQRTAKELAFYSESGLAFNALVQQYALPVVHPFDADSYSPYHYEPLTLQNHDDLEFFIYENDPVKPIISSLIASMTKNPGIRLHIYFIDQAITQAQMDDWIKVQAVPEGLVRSKAITLNRGANEFAKFNDKPRVPALYLIRAGVPTHISTESF
jgi:integrating conjugative element protein (TIGR03759 family)